MLELEWHANIANYEKNESISEFKRTLLEH